MFSVAHRSNAIAAAAKSPFDVLVIGGGVVGCSIAAHLAKAGLSTLLVEREDFATGASGQSTGLAHAGLRYLAQGRVGYVFHESRERRRLEALAPQWVRPFSFIYPVYQGDAFPLWVVRLGTALYDVLAMMDAFLAHVPWPQRHCVRSATEVLQRIPGLRSEGLTGATEYFVDSKVLDARLTLGFAQLAAARGAQVITHAQPVERSATEDGFQRVGCQDHLSGLTFTCRARLVVNATGAWIDQTRKLVNGAGEVVSGSQGTHLVVDRISESPLIFSSKELGRVFFVLPYGRDASLVGTTDRPTSGSPDLCKPTADEINELITNLFDHFPNLSAARDKQSYVRDHVRDIFWAQRPLVAQSGPASHRSREHRIVRDEPFFWSIPGVKLTGARAVGEDVARAAHEAIRNRSAKAIALGRLPGGDVLPWEDFLLSLKHKYASAGFNEATLEYLAFMYGSRAEEVLSLALENAEWKAPVVAGEPWIKAEVVHSAREEMALTLNDFLWRRVKWPQFRRFSHDELRVIASLMDRELSWGNSEVEEQVKAYRIEESRHRIAESEL